MKNVTFSTPEAALAAATGAYPVGSSWEHLAAGTVTVVGHSIWSSVGCWVGLGYGASSVVEAVGGRRFTSDHLIRI